MNEMRSARQIPIVWATHPRHLPKPPGGRVVVVDVAFAAGNQFRSKTLPFIRKLGDRLVRWVDHHEHREGWKQFKDDPRFLLVPNREAHACPELLNAAFIQQAEAAGPVDAIVAHADFDGMIAATKWRLAGREPWPGADEDARAIDSPGRGHALTSKGERYAMALEEASGSLEREARKDFMTRLADAIALGEESIGLSDEIDTLVESAEAARSRALQMVEECGREEVPGVYVIRASRPLENRVRKYLLMAAEVRAPIGALYEPDPQGGAWVTAATFDERIDLEAIAGFEGGRSDYRFARAVQDGTPNLQALSQYLQRSAR